MMLDESIYGLADIEKAARLKAATYVKLKLMKLVTLRALSQAIERIRELGMKPVLGNGVACDPGCWMEGLRKRAEREKVAFGPDLAVQSVYEISEPLEKLLPDKWVT